LLLPVASDDDDDDDDFFSLTRPFNYARNSPGIKREIKKTFFHLVKMVTINFYAPQATSLPLAVITMINFFITLIKIYNYTAICWLFSRSLDAFAAASN
jgi:hypothetical protein